MQYTVLTLLATTASLASAQTFSASASPSQRVIGQIIPIGGNCVSNGTPCALGANCYASLFVETSRLLATAISNARSTHAMEGCVTAFFRPLLRHRHHLPSHPHPPAQEASSLGPRPPSQLPLAPFPLALSVIRPQLEASALLVFRAMPATRV
jgi:hypothetical protein